MSRFQQILCESKTAILAYFKTQLIMSGLTFLILAVGLSLIGINWWGLKAFFIALVDILPVLGSGIIMIPWAIIRALTGSADIGAQLTILYVVLTIIRFIAEPLIVGKSVGLNPLLTLGITLVAMLLLGPLGAILGGILTVFIKVVWTVLNPPLIAGDKSKRARYDSGLDE